MDLIVEISGGDDSCWSPLLEDCREWIRQALLQAGVDASYSLSLRLVRPGESERLNARYRGKRAPANVLSFPAALPPEISDNEGFRPAGDIVICPRLVEREARRQGKSLQAHWAHLLVHGTLHLLGYVHDDPDSAAAMERIEIQVLEKFGFPNPYLIG